MELNLQGFSHSHSDASLFINRNGQLITIAAIYVDDIILTGNDVAMELKPIIHCHLPWHII